MRGLHAPNGASEHAHHALQRFHEAIDLFDGVVEGKRHAGHAFDPATGHERLRAMVAGADGKTQMVEQCAQIHRVNLAHVERND